MTGQMRTKAAVLVALLGAATLAACGGGSSSSAGKPKDTAASHAAAEKLISQAIGTNPKASSARIDGTIDVDVKGIPRYKGTSELTADGTYNLPDGATAPDINMDVGLTLNDHAIGGTLVVANGKGFIKLGDTGYPLPSSISQKLVAPAADRDNGLLKAAAMFHINPQIWQKNAQLVGDKSIAGESTQEITAELRPERFFVDVARLVHMLTLLHVTEAVGLPTAIGPKARAALVRSTKVAKGEVYIAKSDHVLRKAHLTGKLVVAKRDRKILGGMTGATLDAVINISDVGSPQSISAPTQLGSYSDLQLSLNALGEAIRNEHKKGK